MSDLVKSVSITNLVQQREACVERVRQAFGLLKEAAQLAGAGHLDWPRLEIHGGGRCSGTRLFEQGGMQAFFREIDAGGWQYLMRESGLRSLMDHKARAAWDEKIHNHDVPELTHANIEATFTALHDARAEMFERGVIEVFRRLSWDYKTNSPRMFGKKLILTYLVTRHSADYFTFNHRTCDELDDLTRVCHVLDNKPEPDHRGGYYARLSDARGGNEVTDEYLQVRWFKKGTGHVTFLKPEIVERMNAILAKHHPNALAACD